MNSEVFCCDDIFFTVRHTHYREKWLVELVNTSNIVHGKVVGAWRVHFR